MFLGDIEMMVRVKRVAQGWLTGEKDPTIEKRPVPNRYSKRSAGLYSPGDNICRCTNHCIGTMG